MPFRVLGPALLSAAALMLFGAETGRRYAPSIFVGGVVNGASFRPAPDNFVTANSIISIFGDDLSLRTRVVRPDDLVRGRLPESLAGVSVIIANVPAPLYFVSPRQINCQMPSVVVSGTFTVRVNRESLLSPPETIEVRPVSPGLFAWPADREDGTLPAVATHQDFRPVGRGLPDGATPVRAGELVILWATGLGPTTPPVLAGELPNFASFALLPVRVRLNDAVAADGSILYAGQAPGFAGLQQINILLPQDAPTGEVSIAVDVDGVVSQPGMTISIDPPAM